MLLLIDRRILRWSMHLKIALVSETVICDGVYVRHSFKRGASVDMFPSRDYSLLFFETISSYLADNRVYSDNRI